MVRNIFWAAVWCFACGFSPATCLFTNAARSAEFTQPDAAALPDLFLWNDACNVWVLKDGDAALLIDVGDGSVVEALPKLGVKKIEWVLLTHHHREQCQGVPKLRASELGKETKFAAPLAERELFEKPTDFRKMQARLGDKYTIHAASFVRPPIQPIAIDQPFAKMDVFKWRGREFWCIDTKGNSPGGMSYLLRTGERWVAFSGDAMVDGAKLHTWFDSEWDYGFAAGVWALSNSAAQIAGYDPLWLFPSHGPAIKNPVPQLTAFQEKLRKFEKLYLRGYPVLTFSGSHQDRTSRPTKVPHVWQVLPHVYKFRGPDYYPNFYIIIADSGRGLCVDVGQIPPEALDQAIVGMREHLGLKKIDAVLPTHMHGDHFWQVPQLRENWGAEFWALARMKDVCEHPEWFDYSAPVQSYGKVVNGKPVNGVTLDRVLKDGEVLDWEGYKLTVDWMPGQTEFALAVTGMIDGKRVVFTGDNLFGDPSDPNQNGHEAMVAHNSAILEEGYIQGSEYLSKLKPDLILGGHSYVMPEPAAFVERYRKWSYEMRDAFVDLIREDDYRWGFDPFWVRCQPYRSTITAGGEVELTLHLRNFEKRAMPFRVEIHTPPGLTTEPSVIEMSLKPEAREQVKFRVRAESSLKPGVQLIAFDVTRDGVRYGERFDAIVEVVK